MSYPAAVSVTQAVFVIAGVVPIMLGLRRGVVAAGSVRWMRRENISFRTVWIGMTIWSVGIVFNIASAFIWPSAFRLIVWVLIAAATVWMAATLRGLQQRVERGELRDRDNERGRRSDDQDDAR
ncbi:hypothetical protein DEU32_11448 [Curtobacterium sp. AG1037]|uniref:hypothetical protein n=1 Tax=Curtobacterium sp. AG1037 TaxID=2183990 RepID=UPI000E0C1E08|nr:hypothetical protein [Curtobacterium sp. AG1037]RDH95083.1 hypothetical protein DEU32_11448 [Curtobacterium sp. AG1037]